MELCNDSRWILTNPLPPLSLSSRFFVFKVLSDLQKKMIPYIIYVINVLLYRAIDGRAGMLHRNCNQVPLLMDTHFILRIISPSTGDLKWWLNIGDFLERLQLSLWRREIRPSNRCRQFTGLCKWLLIWILGIPIS